MNIEFSLQVLLALLLGIFLFLESISAIWQISHHDGSLHASKYVFTALVGFWLCIKALVTELDWLEIAEAAALSAFVARRVLWRLGHKRHHAEDIRIAPAVRSPANAQATDNASTP